MTSIGSDEVDYEESDIEWDPKSFKNDDQDDNRNSDNEDENRESDNDSNVDDVATGVPMDIVNDDKDEENRLEVENKRIASKRTHSDNSDNERESKRVSRRTKAHEEKQQHMSIHGNP